MKTPNIHQSLRRRFAAATLALIACALASQAADISDPVGMFRVHLRGNSDTLVSLPLQRAPLVEASVDTGTETTLQLIADIPTLPSEGAFALVMSGTLEGAVLPITNVSGRTLTVDPGGYNLTGMKNETFHGALQADIVAVIPYWSLDTLFPAGLGVHVSTSPLLIKSQVLMFDDTPAGKNHSAAAIYYYYQGTALLGSGWYRFGQTEAKAGATTIPPHRYIIVRHDEPGDTDLYVFGGVQMAGFRVVLATRAANEDQDNRVALPVPMPVTLAASRLVESGAFQPSTSPLLIADQLLFFDNTRIAKNKSAAAIYYYYQGTAMLGTGWYRLGDPSQRADAVTLVPGAGVIVRKIRAAEPLVKFWAGVPAYLQ